MTKPMHAQTEPKRAFCAPILPASLAAILAALAGCGGPVEKVEQVRRSHSDTMGHPAKVSYEIGDDWVAGTYGRYTRADIPEDDVSLYVDVDSARYKGDDFAARLAKLKKGPNNGRKRERITAQLITLDEQPAVEFAMRQESSRDHNRYFVVHRFEFIRGDYYITVKLSTRDEYYDGYVDQLRHTADTVELVTSE